MDNNNNVGRPQAKTQDGRYDYTINQQIPVGVSWVLCQSWLVDQHYSIQVRSYLAVIFPHRHSKFVISKLLMCHWIDWLDRAFCLLSGQAKYKAVYSRQTQQWVAKPIYEGTTQAFLDDLVERVLRRREDSSVVLSKPMHGPRPRRRRLLCNIAPVPRPDKSDVVAKARSRYMTMF